MRIVLAKMKEAQRIESVACNIYNNCTEMKICTLSIIPLMHTPLSCLRIRPQ